MNRRLSVVVAVIGLSLMACCCGPGFQPQKGPPLAQNNPAAGGQIGQEKPLQNNQPPPEKLTKVKFNQQLIDRYSLVEREFPSLQYYIATDLVMSREVSKEDSKKPSKGKLVQSKGQIIEEIGISNQTPGVCVEAQMQDDGSHVMTMSFEDKTTIFFRRLPNEDGYTLAVADKGIDAEVKFIGNTYKVPAATVRPAYLVVAEQSLENFQKNRKDLKGVKLPPQ